MAGFLPSRAYNSNWKYTATAKDEGRDSDGGSYTFRYDSESTKSEIMGFKTYYRFDASKHIYKWNWDIKVNFGTIDNNNSTDIIVTIEDNDGIRRTIAKANFVGYNNPTIEQADRPVFINHISSSGDFKYMFTLEYQPTPEDLRAGIKRIYIQGYTKWKNNGRNFQYERDLDISSYKNMVPEYSCELDDEGNYLFHVNGTPKVDGNKKYLGKYFYGKVSYGYSSYTDEWKRFDLTEENRSGGTDDKADYTFTVPVKTYTAPLRIGKLDYTVDVKRHTQLYNGDEHYKYSLPSATGDAYGEGILFKPYTRVDKLTAEFDKWKKQNVIQWTRNMKMADYVNYKRVEIDCLTDGSWYVLRYEKGQSPSSYEIIKEISGNSTNLKVEDSDIDYDKEYVYRVVFLPKLLKEKYADKLVNLPGESQTHSKYDLWEESTVSTVMEVPIKLAQDRSDDSGIHLTWEYNVQKSGCEWRIDKHRLGQSTWTPVTTIPIDTKQSTASYLEEGGSVCDLYVYRIMAKINDKELFSDTLVCNMPAGSYISDVEASTGTEEKHVVVKWKVARPSDDDIWFRILRRPIGSNEWTVLDSNVHGHETEYSYIDDRVMAGSYYEYTVEAYGAKCDEQMVKTDTKTAPGFSQARGTITGHIAYGTGTAVSGVRVNLVKSSADEGTSQPQFLSRFIEGEGKGLQWTADSAEYAGKISGKQALTLQMWVRPQIDNDAAFKPLLVLNNVIELGAKTLNGTDYYLYAYDATNPAKQIYDYPELKFDNYDFTHLAATYSEGKWTLYAGNDTLHSETFEAADQNWTATFQGTGQPTMSIGGSYRLTEAGDYPTRPFAGFVDDIRLWKRALTEKEIYANYSRILGGMEDGLLLYWPLDEGINVKDYAFDVARQDGLYLLNHPEVGINARPSDIVPSTKYLALYGLTDAEGDYIIRGIPFQQGGTNYKLAPDLGIHEFNPNTRSMFISPTSLTANNIDFEDVSSFPMSGHIYYAGTNIPVEDIQLFVDGELMTGNGEVKKTDSNGFYEISVPIGEHYVEAKLDGHKMVAGGRFPTQGNFNFDRAMQYDFADSTLVNFVGRVDGALRNDTLAVGFGLSKNNIGVATVQLKLNNESFSFNCQDDHITDATTERTWDSDTISINSHAWTGTGYDAKYIYIRTDSLTGEFSALLPPLNYVTKSIRVNSNPDIEFNSLPQIDLTNVKKEEKDSLKRASELQEGEANQYYTYNTKMVSTHYATPEVRMWQKNSGAGFGEQELRDYSVSSTETANITDIWTQQKDGSVTYTYGFPIFNRSTKYTFCLRGFEAYANYDSGEAVCDTIPMNGQILTIENEMSDDQSVVAKVIDSNATNLKPGDVYNLKSNQLTLDEDGCNEVTFTTGLPNITAPYTRQFNLFYERDKRTYNGPQINGVVLGELTDGNNFVTQGPDIVSMVLRDPPGSKSKTTWRTGTIRTKIENKTRAWSATEQFQSELIWGSRLMQGVGMGVMIVTTNEVNTIATVGERGTGEWLTKNSNTWVHTTANNIATSTGIKYVGSAGDVYIGTSHNLIIGNCRKVGFHREAEGIVLGLKDAISMSDSIKTGFAYSQYDIINTMIPKLIDTRNALLEYKDSTAAATYKNMTDQDVYLTWLTKDDPNYGKDSTYVWKQGKNGRSQDMVLCYNEAIRQWKETIAWNEKDKVKAFNDYSKFYKENRSFDGGTSYSYSERRDTTKSEITSDSYTATVLGSVKHRIGVTAGASFGANWEFKAEGSRKWVDEDGDFDKNVSSYAEFDYEMNDGNPGTDFTVDIYKSPEDWSDIFLLRGGQSYNPYEAEETTLFYDTLKNHIISYGTQRMEQPIIYISTDGNVGAKSAVQTDVPSGQNALFTLHLTNGTKTNQEIPLLYTIVIPEDANTQGLEILMDGVIANGRNVFINPGETIKKVITVRQTDQSVLDYNDVKILFVSQYQPFDIQDAVRLSVHFAPSSSPIDLALDEPVLNIETLDRDGGNLMLKMTNFNRMYKNLKSVGVQYRYEGNTQWNTIHTYVTNIADSLNESYSPMPDASTIRYTYNMKDDNMFPQGTYTFRAFTTTPYGTELVSVYSDEVTVFKDNIRPRNLSTPTPANGILRHGDDISIEFNEDIVPGYVSDKNIIVTAKLNNQPIQHEVAKKLRPFGDEQATENPIFLNGDFSIDFWMNWENSGSIIRLGSGQLELGIDDEGHIVASIGGVQVISKDVVPKNKWTYIVLSYKSGDNTKFSALAQYDATTLQLFTDETVNNIAQLVHYSQDNYLYLGDMNGAIHDLSLFSIYRDVYEAAAKKNQAKDCYVYGLVNYWPMNEGHGHVANDLRHTHNFCVNDTWLLDNINYSLRLDDEKGVQTDISRINTTVGDSYAIEMWVNLSISEDSNEITIFETGNTEHNRLGLYYINGQDDWVLRYGNQEKAVASHVDFTQTNSWNHIALNVVRGQAASFFFNGQRTAVISERDIPPIQGAYLIMGKGMGGFSNIDEVRIWHAALSESRLLNNMYNCIDTTDVYSRGLVAYYPFEKAGTVNGVSTMVETLENLAPKLLGDKTRETLTPLGDYQSVSLSPPLKNAPMESRLIAVPVASERKVVINLFTTEGIAPRDLEGSTLNITVDKIHDMHGNQSNPIRWTAYMQMNTLKWMKDSVNIIKQYGDDYTFDVNIENRGGSTEYYTLYNMPAWLTLVDSERSDEISPLSVKTLRFKVTPLVAVGNYDVTIGLQGNDEILEPLRIVMKVRGEQPAWNVDPNAYENTMSIVGQIYINGILMGNSESLLAAFIDNECRGIVSPKQVRGAAYVAMTIYGNALQTINGQTANLDMDRPVSFRIWDATTGMTYTNVNITLPDGRVTDVVSFDPTDNYGTFDHPLIFTKSNLVEQPLNIRTGWNWLSLGVEPTNPSISEVLMDLVTWDAQLKDKNTGVAYCRGKYWAGSMKEVHANTMYKLQLTRMEDSKDLPQPLIVNGAQMKLADTPVTLRKDWNWIAYTPMMTISIDEALAGANPKEGDQVKSQTGFAYYGPYGWEGNLEALESGKGYLYHSLDTLEKKFVYPTVASERANRPRKSIRSDAESVFSPVNPTDYPDNMAIVIMLTDGGESINDAEIAAFIDGECRGTAFADEDLYYLLVAGEGSGQSIEIKANINGIVQTVCTTLTYVSDGSIGTPWNPYIIDISNPTGINISQSTLDNDGSWYSLQGIFLGTTKPTISGVYLHNGQKVVIRQANNPSRSKSRD